MKKLAASVLVLSFVAVAAGCDKGASSAPASSSTAAATAAPAGSAAPATDGTKKTGSGW